ncbi:MAG: ubiquinol-cytochrome c reductase iron-sulfur subunit [Mangrovibacterium sp.]
MDRRNFLKKAIGGVIGLQFVALFYSFFKNKPEEKKENDDWVELGMINDFEKGKTYSFPSNKVFLHRTGEGDFLAISNKCTHLGCAVTLDSRTSGFICPCHSSHFDKLGNVTQSPAKRALDYYPIRIQANKLLVNLNDSTKRASFSKNQLTTVS